MAEFFARGFYRGVQAKYPNSSAVTRIAIGTNNGGVFHDLGRGADWGTTVQNIYSWLTNSSINGMPNPYPDGSPTAGADYTRNVSVWAGDDIEASLHDVIDQYGDPNDPNNHYAPNEAAFLDGFASTQSRPIEDYGDCAGCPSTYSSTNPNIYVQGKWQVNDYWYASWGAARAFPLPEIYFTTQPAQWQTMSLYSILAKNDLKLDFHGSFSQWSACQQSPTDPQCTSGSEFTLTPEASWQALDVALTADTRTTDIPDFSSDVRRAAQ